MLVKCRSICVQAGTAASGGRSARKPVPATRRLQRRRFEIPASSAASSLRDFKSTSGTGNHRLLVPFIFSKFVSEIAARYHELRKEGTSARPGKLSSIDVLPSGVGIAPSWGMVMRLFAATLRPQPIPPRPCRIVLAARRDHAARANLLTTANLPTTTAVNMEGR